MPTSAEIVRVLDLEELGADCFLGHQPPASTLDKLYGGQLFGQALVAACRTVDPRRPAHALQAFCLAPGDHDSPVHYRVERLRDGRSFSARSVLATQDGRPLLRTLISFHAPEPGLTHAATMPKVPLPESLPSLQDVLRDHSELPDEPWRREWEGVDIRYVATNIAASRKTGSGIQQMWMRVRDRLPDDPELHRAVLVYLSDLGLLSTSLLPHGVVLGAPELPRATLSHNVWLHASARADEWLLIDQRSSWAGGARGLGQAEVYRADGRHVASLAQEGLVRPHGRLRRRLGIDEELGE